ncbi:sugar transporter SWEET1 isoform X2 [Danaus plexippus]|uniref:sugar transporter SWEET1 isoform X2 n=1 Tax=Danaus plexippus TaxID=13037 RepID=UPI0013C52F02|nr:sugar transporter SWEET1 isoform X2 [Danaus plexippus]
MITLVCRQYVVNRTTAEASPLPFICGFLSSGLWLLYGICKPDSKIIIVNVVGVLLMLSYSIVFYVYTFKKSSVLKQSLVAIILYLVMVVYMSTEIDNEILLVRLGYSACLLTLLTISAPMSKLFYVIRTKCTDCLPFPMIFMSFIVSSLWFIYGCIVQDVFLSIPNFIGASLAVAQLSLFVVYPSVPQTPLLLKMTEA